jgi:putative tryptophan/tyrosine transport system substrate-binding protein
MRRRDFVRAIVGSATAWPLTARAQQVEHVRRIGVLLPWAADNAIFQARMAAFLEGLQQLGWTDGRNVRIDTRWSAGDADLMRKYAGELVALRPDVVMTFSSNAVPPLQQVTRTIPIVFALVADPVGAGYVESLAQPSGNVTGFTTFEYAIRREMAGAAQRDCTSHDASGSPSRLACLLYPRKRTLQCNYCSTMRTDSTTNRFVVPHNPALIP